MSTAPASSLTQNSKWTMLNGAMKGAVQELSSQIVIIGRSSDCDIIIVNDPKASRKHAKVEITHRGYEIQSLSSNNPLRVNGEQVQSATLKDGDIIAIGDTELRFNFAMGAPPIALSSPLEKTWVPQIVPNAAPPTAPYDYSKAIPTGAGSPPPRPRPSKGINKRVYIYGGLALVVIWLFTGSPLKKKAGVKIRTPEQIEQDIEAAKKMQIAAEEMRRKSSNQNPSFEMRQAQENYVKGFRDFRKGQYERALESFQACLSLAPDHTLCNRYLRLSQRKFDELIQYHMVLGRKYRDQEQYRACRAAFRNVMVMVKEASSPTYREAKANFDACNSFVEGNF